MKSKILSSLLCVSLIAPSFSAVAQASDPIPTNEIRTVAPKLLSENAPEFIQALDEIKAQSLSDLDLHRSIEALASLNAVLDAQIASGQRVVFNPRSTLKTGALGAMAGGVGGLLMIEGMSGFSVEQMGALGLAILIGSAGGFLVGMAAGALDLEFLENSKIWQKHEIQVLSDLEKDQLRNVISKVKEKIQELEQEQKSRLTSQTP